MRSFRLAALLFSLLLPASLTAALSCAAPGSGAEATAARAKDARLKQRVTSRAVDLPLRTWLEQLSRQTGVSLRTAPDEEDRAITVRVAGMPLGDLMKGVTSLFGDFWLARGEKEAPAYVLEPSLARRSRQRRYLETYYRTLQDALT